MREVELPFWATIAKAFRMVLDNPIDALRATLVPLLAALAVAVAWVDLLAPMLVPSEDAVSNGTLWQALHWVVGTTVGETLVLPFISMIAVAWHRFILLDERPQLWFRLGADQRLWRYTIVAWTLTSGAFLLPAAAAILVARIVPPDLLPAKAFLYLFIVISVLALVYFTTVIAINLPAIAIGDNAATLLQTIKRTEYNFLRILVGSIICALPCYVVVVLLFALLPGQWADSDLATEIVWVGTLALSTTLLAGFLSFAYREFYSPGDVA